MSEKLERSFFMTDPLTVSRGLLGWRLCFKGCEGMIVETEAYEGLGDPACHTFTRPSTRRFVEEYPAGTAYVYLNYGVHWLFNVLVKGDSPEKYGFVLVRSVLPRSGVELMKARRFSQKIISGKQELELCNGPGKLTKAFGINQSHHGLDLFSSSEWSFIKDPITDFKILETPRIGISQAKERLWRFIVS